MKASLKSIDDFLKRAEAAKNDDELRRIFQGFEQEYDLDLPRDPFSDEYRKAQFSLYEYLHGAPYSVINEASPLNVEEMSVRPFPYCHQSSQLVGNHLLAVGFIIKAMGLPPGARILEFGPGWGNTTLALAKMGYDVTAVDIEQNFVDLIRKRAAMEKLDIRVSQGDFSLIWEMQDKFDAILFFECFHHSADHLGLIASFDRVLNSGGLVCFGAEPITDDFPIPWGLRMDGESLWAIRQNGWLELGFNRDYFDQALSRHGFLAIEHVGSDGPWSKALIAKRKSDMVRTYRYDTGALHYAVGELSSRGLAIRDGDQGYLAYGPYERLPKGLWQVEVVVDERSPKYGGLLIDVVDLGGRVQVLSPTPILLSEHRNVYVADFSCGMPLEAFEFRLLTEGNCQVVIRKINLRYCGSESTGSGVSAA